MQSEDKNTTLDSGDWLEPKAEGGHPQQSLERTERTVEPFSQLHRWGNESFLQVEQRTVEQLCMCAQETDSDKCHVPHREIQIYLLLKFLK